MYVSHLMKPCSRGCQIPVTAGWKTYCMGDSVVLFRCRAQLSCTSRVPVPQTFNNICYSALLELSLGFVTVIGLRCMPVRLNPFSLLRLAILELMTNWIFESWPAHTLTLRELTNRATVWDSVALLNFKYLWHNEESKLEHVASIIDNWLNDLS